MPKWNATSRKLVHSDVVDSQRESKWQQVSKCRYPESLVGLLLTQHDRGSCFVQFMLLRRWWEMVSIAVRNVMDMWPAEVNALRTLLVVVWRAVGCDHLNHFCDRLPIDAPIDGVVPSACAFPIYSRGGWWASPLP